MQKLQQSMRLYAVNDERIGEVGSISQCCFEVTPIAGGPQIRVQQKAIFNIEKDFATLVCDAHSLARYECDQPEHAAAIDEG